MWWSSTREIRRRPPIFASIRRHLPPSMLEQRSFTGHVDPTGKRGVVISRTAGGDGGRGVVTGELHGGEDDSLSDKEEEEDHGGGGGGTPFFAGDGCSCTGRILHT